MINYNQLDIISLLKDSVVNIDYDDEKKYAHKIKHHFYLEHDKSNQTLYI